MAMGTQLPLPRLLNFYVHDSFKTSFMANSTLQSVAEDYLWLQLSKLLFIENDTSEMSANCSVIHLQSSM